MFVLKNVDKFPEIVKALVFLIKMNPNVVKALGQNEDFVAAIKRLSSNESLDLTEIDDINEVLEDIGLAKYKLKGGSKTIFNTTPELEITPFFPAE